MTLQELFIRRKAQKSLSDDLLMERLQHGDESAFKVLYERYSNPIFIYCLRMMNERRCSLNARPRMSCDLPPPGSPPYRRQSAREK